MNRQGASAWHFNRLIQASVYLEEQAAMPSFGQVLHLKLI